MKAKLLGADPEADIALLEIPAENLVAVPMGDAEALEVGDFVVAIGNPFRPAFAVDGASGSVAWSR